MTNDRFERLNASFVRKLIAVAQRHRPQLVECWQELKDLAETDNPRFEELLKDFEAIQ
jgi:hypothetical protein